MQYYQLPFNVSASWKNEHVKINLYESVRQHLQLMLATTIDESSFSPFFGTTLSEMLFDYPNHRTREEDWKIHKIKSIKKTLKKSIEIHEPRIVKVDSIRIEHKLLGKNSQSDYAKKGIKRLLLVVITAKLKDTNDYTFDFMFPFK